MNILQKIIQLGANKKITVAKQQALGALLVRNNVTRTRTDIANWQTAYNSATKVDVPSNHRLQNIYQDVCIDALLSSQIQNRKLAILASPFLLKKGDKEDTTHTQILQQWKNTQRIIGLALDAIFFGNSLMELVPDDAGGFEVTLIPRQHVIHQQGLFIKQVSDTAGIEYRLLPNYKHTLLEARYDSLGLLNKAIPHVLFKRFAQSCWSEFCEIFGMPPRIAKTNTQDPTMVARMETMMRSMGSAPYAILDETEELVFGQASTANGEVYQKIIALCNNELSMLISGAVLGQDTQYGNRSKEEQSIRMLDRIIAADKVFITDFMNNQALPALAKLGIISEGLNFEFVKTEDLQQLWNMTKEALPFYEVSPEWIKQKFGIQTTAVRSKNTTQLNTENDFFA